MLKIIQLNLKLREKKIQCLTHPALRSSSSPTLSTSDWANLPEDILDEIIKKMCYVDYSTFGAVCKSWGFMYIDRFFCFPRNIPFGVPILFLSTCNSGSNFHKIAKMNGEIASGNIFMPEAANKRVCGSSWGWLILEDIDSREVSLLNPFTRHVIQLPSIDTFTDEPNVPFNGFNYIYKAILSTNPSISKQNCIVMAIVGQIWKLYYCKIGDKKWTTIDGYFAGFSDVIYYNGIFFATTDYGELVSFDIIDPNVTKTIASAPPIDYYYSSRKYLVMASGRLLLVHSTEKDRYKIHLLKKKCSLFAIHLDLQYKWVEIDSIGDQMLFVGNNGSFSLPSHRRRANCIYFTEKAFALMPCYNDAFIGDLAETELHCNHSFGMYDIAKKSTGFHNREAQNELFRSFWMIPSS